MIIYPFKICVCVYVYIHVCIHIYIYIWSTSVLGEILPGEFTNFTHHVRKSGQKSSPTSPQSFLNCGFCDTFRVVQTLI